MPFKTKLKKYNVICPECNQLRYISYGQFWNINTGKSSGCCSKCKKGINIKGLKLGHGWNKGIPMKKESRNKISRANKNKNLNEDNPAWKGKEVGYFGLHAWINNKLGRPKQCENCGKVKAKKFEWANKNHTYKRNLKDWVRLCVSCHRLYDHGKISLIKKPI